MISANLVRFLVFLSHPVLSSALVVDKENSQKTTT